ncbi:copper amine oxidase N-terminal domain-containing protein [Rummeliibacillus suwonensis]|uniref:copper amine oxidase N-terminal domain-containing protein n=1 Tax=Rummeliibacillus suwonensis TaxID=1306154 RepID=UPI001AAE6D43|nr:copper amine oxidase N-terminal domain-containing protein [Rummeliibacillus suwonensis]MBO2536097.1 copper amine oxidase N-terminal domain-containing protein [Rummeliibacillus suwonensis]
MKKKIVFFIISLVTTLSIGQYIVHADDDDHEYYEKYENHGEKEEHHKDYDGENDEKWDDEDEEYYEDDGYYEDEENDGLAEQGKWNLWTRSMVQNDGVLPFNDSKTVNFAIEGKTIKCYVIPKNGDVFVPVQKLTEALGGQVTYYKTSKIMDAKLKDEQLIFRVNTNVVYENLTKTPMTSKTFLFNKDVYVPASVLLNAYGYSVDWQEEKQQFICQSLNK